ncbi:MAG: nicotinate-nucleotide adenylyltransferase [candidate division Zixibacteria bacterium]|nr:nicotinate-nucleotide adenylyltransferase [candidate division Zixibacteria bacterium]
MRKVGILGGIFDPVHIGHLHIGDGVCRKLGLEKLLLVPSGDPPHKKDSPVASGEHRLRMLKNAVADNSLFEITDIELKRRGKSYTADTLKQLRQENPDWEPYFIIGGDNLTEIPTWKTPEKIFMLAKVVVVNRPGYDAGTESSQLPGEAINITLPGINLSSTDIRGYIRGGISCRYLLPPGVEDYIIKHKLYTR